MGNEIFADMSKVQKICPRKQEKFCNLPTNGFGHVMKHNSPMHLMVQIIKWYFDFYVHKINYY